MAPETLADRLLSRLLRPVIARIDRAAARSIRQDEAIRALTQETGRLDRRLAGVDRELRRTGRLLQELRDELSGRKMGGQIRRIERNQVSLLRRTLVAVDTLPYPERLAAARGNVISQNGGDGILLALLEALPSTPKTFVDIGSGASGGATAVLSRVLGWRGLMVDGNASHAGLAAGRFPQARVATVGAFVTAENANELVRSHGLTGDIGVLAIDIDGVDYWIWRALDVCRPAIVVVEYNAFFGLSRAVTVPYAADFTRQALPGRLRKHYMGASLPAFVSLGREKGYRLVATDDPGLNAFFLRDDLAHHIPACALDALPYQEAEIGKYPDIYAAIAEAGLPLIDVG